MPRGQDSAEAQIEVFSKSLNAWVPGRVWLFAAAGKITVTYTVNGQRCRKHLDPWTEQIRSLGEMDPDCQPEGEAGVLGGFLPSWEEDEEADHDFNLTHMFDALFTEMPVNTTLKNAMGVAAQKQELYCAARGHKPSSNAASLELQEATQRHQNTGRVYSDSQDSVFNASLGFTSRLGSVRDSRHWSLFGDRPRAEQVLQGPTSVNCAFQAAMAVIADYHDGFLVRQLFPKHKEMEGLSPSGCYVVSLFLHTRTENLQHLRKQHPSLVTGGHQRILLDTTSRSERLTKGSWRSIVVDDQMPVDSDGRFTHSPPGKGAVWPCLLEKAFAKVCGSYDRTSYVELGDALMMLTGQSTFEVDLTQLFPKEKRQLWKDLAEYQKSGILMTAAVYDLDISTAFFGPTVAFTSSGLKRNHAYSVLETLTLILDGTGEVLSLVKLRNPHGHTTYKGAWGPKYSRWPADLHKKAHGGDEGAFCMTWEDFLKTFHELNICQIGDASS